MVVFTGHKCGSALKAWGLGALAACLVLYACSNPNSAPVAPNNPADADDAMTETSVGEDASLPDINKHGTEDVLPTNDTASEDLYTPPPPKDPPKDLGDGCTTDLECEEGICVDGPEGKQCSMPCGQGCPPGWLCKPKIDYAELGGYVCVPLKDKTCFPCSADADCGGIEQRCVEVPKEGKYCARKCSLNYPCPEGFDCESLTDELNLCMPSSGSCICNGALLGAKQACTRKNSFGECDGITECPGAGGWTSCSATEPMADICDGLDNDCDGDVDENLNGAVCEATNEFGTCEGAWFCQGAVGMVCNAPTPSAEACDGLDNDCDGLADEPDALGCTLYYKDEDNDGLGTPQSPQCLCAPIGKYTATQPGDCNDFDAFISGAQPEICNLVDDDCDGVIDPPGVLGCTQYFKDVDGDGHGDPDTGLCLCQPTGYYKVQVGDDCDDASWAIQPGGTEVCNTVDDDCDGVVDEPGALYCTPYLHDADGDGFGVTGLMKCMCKPEGNYTAANDGDCDDANPDLNPLAIEVCDGLDNNCNGMTDEDCDKDNDGYCEGAIETVPISSACPMGGGDCVDWDPWINPGVAEECDWIDNNCDGTADEGVQAPCGGCEPVCVMDAGPDTTEPFNNDPEVMDGAGIDDDGNVVLDKSSIKINMIWVANSGEGTVSKINTETGAEEARYKVCSDPSRTAVDSQGNCWVACRGDGQVSKIMLNELDCVDKNGNGVIDTSKSSNTMAAGQDECVLFTVAPGGSCARAMGVDKDDHGWAGMWNQKKLRQIDRDDGHLIKTINIPNNPYGLGLDQQGIIWISGRGGGHLVRVDPSNNSVQQFKPPGCVSLYGMTIDENGRIWLANYSCNTVYRFSPGPNTFSTISLPPKTRGIAANTSGYVFVASDSSNKVTKIDVNSMAQVGSVSLGGGRHPIGMGVDFDGKVWAINHGNSSATRINPDNMTKLFETSTGSSPYTYSDMTGFQQKTVVAPQGSYIHEFEGWSGVPTRWLKVSISTFTPSDSSAKLRVRAADSLANIEAAMWTPYFGPFPPTDPTVNLNDFGAIIGRYLQVEVVLMAGSDKSAPTLKNIDVVASIYEQ